MIRTRLPFRAKRSFRLNESEGPRLVRLPVSGGAPQPIPFRSELRLQRWGPAPNAVAKDGRVVLRVARDDSWFAGVAVLDPRTGKVQEVPIRYPVDMQPGWGSGGRIVDAGPVF